MSHLQWFAERFYKSTALQWLLSFSMSVNEFSEASTAVDVEATALAIHMVFSTLALNSWSIGLLLGLGEGGISPVLLTWRAASCCPSSPPGEVPCCCKSCICEDLSLL